MSVGIQKITITIQGNAFGKKNYFKINLMKSSGYNIFKEALSSVDK